MRPLAPPTILCLILARILIAEDVSFNQTVQVTGERVVAVNTVSICKTDVEERMGATWDKLRGFRQEKEALGMWNEATEAEWTKFYVEAFREALRPMVRERLMLQGFEKEKMSIDERVFQKRFADFKNALREQKIPFDSVREAKRLREAMMIEEFRGKFDNQLEFPKRFEVEKYYREHIDRCQRKAAAQIRIVRLDLSVEDKLTGKKTIRTDPYDTLSGLLSDIKNGVSFSEAARTRNDDPALRERSGLLLNSAGDSFIVPEEFDKIIAEAIRDLKAGEVSQKPFSYGKSYAIAMVESRRPAGPAPLDDKLYKAIYEEVYRAKRIKSEDEWFRAALSKSVILQMSGGVSRPIPIEFFFPEDARNPDFIAGSASGKIPTSEKPAPKEEHKK